MRELKFTPGPWSHSDERECKAKHFATIISMCDHREHRGTEIAKLYGRPPYSDGEGQANANLIASAPELYEACKKALSALDVLMGDSDLPEDDSQEMQACQAIASAIAKAEGKNQ